MRHILTVMVKLFHVEMTLSESIDLQMQVMDIHGRIVHKESMNNLGNKVSKSIDLSDEPSGTYLLRFINGE
ncbi:T9SS type A sorting domain-containing protein, partial [Saprospiraceae bacterium]|nr:T9SS type A sorting domain-containing protein [Saprospiraceae bacterium]